MPDIKTQDVQMQDAVLATTSQTIVVKADFKIVKKNIKICFILE